MANKSQKQDALAVAMAKIAELEQKVADAEQASAVIDRLQLNGFLTVPKGQKQELVGRSFTATVTLKGKFGTSKSGNASARLTAKVPLDSIELTSPVAPAAE